MHRCGTNKLELIHGFILFLSFLLRICQLIIKSVSLKFWMFGYCELTKAFQVTLLPFHGFTKSPLRWNLFAIFFQLTTWRMACITDRQAPQYISIKMLMPFILYLIDHGSSSATQPIWSDSFDVHNECKHVMLMSASSSVFIPFFFI